MTPDVEIRRITADEVAELRVVVRRYWLQLMPHAPVVIDPQMGERYFAEHFGFGRSERHFWWATVAEFKVGFAFVELGKSLEDLGAQIADFYIERAYQRQGHGTAFAQALIAWLRSEGVYRIDLNVRQDNPGALAFWKSVGFDIALYVVRQYLA
jgi:ribosomal protein S18 acetylase RimI-like enzyme